MGLLRLVLSYSVAAYHFGAIRFGFISATTAVIIFFMISGFYMSMIVEEKYGRLENWRTRFLLNRALRLYPAYWIVAIVAACLFAFTGELNVGSSITERLAWAGWNLTFFGHDIYTALNTAHRLPDLTELVPQAWSLGVEAVFYVLFAAIPLRFHRLGIYGFCSLLSAVIRFIVHLKLGTSLSVIYFPFFSNLVFFFIGASSYKAYGKLRSYISPYAAGFFRYAIPLAVFLFFTRRYFSGMPDLDSPASWLLYFAVFLILPILWHVTKASSLDRKLGDYSYPLYIVHLLVRSALNHIHSFGPGIKSAVGLLISFGVATLLIEIEKPIDRLRHLVVAKGSHLRFGSLQKVRNG